MSLKLIRLTKEYEKDLQEMIAEWKLDQVVNHTDTSPGAIFRHDCADFDYYLANLDNKNTDNGYAPSTVFFLLDEDRNRLLGAVDIRHYLTDRLLVTGGHIGDGIRPSERRKGYGTKIIALALLECKKMGIDKVLITCNSSNIGSRKAILANGGVLENIIEDEDGPLERYWITIK